MKKVLLSTAAFAGLALASVAPAQAADGVTLELGGYASGYVVYTDQDEGADSLRKFDFRKDTEVHLTGETTLDNGLTVGAHIEVLADRGDNDDIGGDAGNDSGLIEESYLYMSGGWGRVNFGEEDGAAYLLQVAAPSADDKIDGLRPDIGTFGLATLGFPGLTGTIDYANDVTGYSNKITYLTPIFNGFQAGVSFTPTVAGTGLQGDLDGLSPSVTDDDADEFENAWEGAVRYETSFEGFDIALGAGYSHASLEEDAGGVDFDDDVQTWNVGANVGVAGWGFGAAYYSSNNGVDDDGDTDIIVAGVDYTTGPYKLGVSYLNYDQELGATDGDADRYTAGVTYEYGPGMSFRGAVQYIDAEIDGLGDADGTQVTLGTQVNF